MRRVLPWMMLGLLSVGLAVGAAVGQVESPGQTPAQWLDGVVAETEAKGTARVHYVNVTTSSDPSLASTAVGIGVVDFTNGNFRVTELERGHQYESINGGAPRLAEEIGGQETIAIGRILYTDLGSVDPSAGWSQSHFQRDRQQDFGLEGTGAEDAVGALVGPTPADAVRLLGRSSIDGVSVTSYRVTTQPLYVCGAHGRTLYFRRSAPTTVWVDGQGRLVRARTSLYNPSITSHGPPDASGLEQPISIAASRITATLTFARFGAPVRITAPPVNTSGVFTGGTISVSLKGSTAPCRG